MNADDEKKRLSIAYREVFNSDNGKIVLEDMKKKAQYNTTTSPPVGNDGHTDVYRVMYKQGQRCVITEIERKLRKG